MNDFGFINMMIDVAEKEEASLAAEKKKLKKQLRIAKKCLKYVATKPSTVTPMADIINDYNREAAEEALLEIEKLDKEK